MASVLKGDSAAVSPENHPSYQFSPIYQVIDHWATSRPTAAAVGGQGELSSFAELEAATSQLAARLQHLGIRRGDVVGVWADGHPQTVHAVLAIHKAGAAYLPIDPTAPTARIDGMLGEAEVSAVVAHNPAEVMLGEYQATVLPVVDATEPAHPFTPVKVGPTDLAYVIYTSGSTGTPKGCKLSHNNLSYLVWANIETFDAPVGRFLDVMPLYFDLSVAAIFWTLATGGTVYLPGVSVRRSASDIADRLQQYQITHAVFIPSVWARVLDVLEQRQVQLPHLANVTLCGEPFPLPVARHHQRLMPEVELYNMYGPTEATVWCSAFQANEPFEDVRDYGTVPIGLPLPLGRLYLLDEDLKPVSQGEQGELYIAGPGVALGYNKRPDITAQRFLPDCIANDGTLMYRTGDFVIQHSDGLYEFLCRVDDEIKLRGHRITLGEIEAALHEHPCVEQAAVIVHEQASGSKSLVAYAIARDENVTSGELLNLVATKVPTYMVPNSLHLTDELPRLPNGKVNRNELKKRHAETVDVHSACREASCKAESAAQHVSPVNETHAQLHVLWRELLGRNVTADENFFDAGGDSLMAMDLLLDVERVWDRRLSITSLLEQPTIRHLARVIDAVDDVDWTPLVPMSLHEGKRPFYFIHPGGGSVLSYLDILRHLGDRRSFYGLQAPGVDGVLPPADTVEEAAELYLTAVRKVQPTGPYALAGWSFGGLIAYEMGRRLHAEGEPIELIGIIESGLLYGVHVLKQLFDGTDIPMFLLKGMDLSPYLDNFRRHATLGRIVPEGAPDKVVERIFKVFIANGLATADFRAKPTEAPLTLFTAEKPLKAPSKKYSPWKDWSRLTENIEEFTIPGDHLTCIVEPNVGVLADKLGSCLSE